MSPIIAANSYLIFHHFIYRRFLTVGKLVRVQHPIYGSIVKRICHLEQQGGYRLEGLNEQSVSNQIITKYQIK